MSSIHPLHLRLFSLVIYIEFLGDVFIKFLHVIVHVRIYVTIGGSSFGPLERGAMSGHEMLPQIPLILHHFLTHIASHALGLDVYIHYVLFQIKAI